MTTANIKGLEFRAITVEQANDSFGYCIDDFGLPVYLKTGVTGATVISWTGYKWVCDIENDAEGLMGQGTGSTPEDAFDRAIRNACEVEARSLEGMCAEDRVNCTVHHVCDSLRQAPMGKGLSAELFDGMYRMCVYIVERKMALELTRDGDAAHAMEVIRDQLIDTMAFYKGREVEAEARVRQYIKTLTGKEV